MQSNGDKNKQRELDEFWDISKLVVEQRHDKASPRPRFDTTTHPLELPAAPSSGGQEHSRSADHAIPIPPRKQPNETSPMTSTAPVEPVVYHPEHPLIEQVTLHPWRNDFPYYERFCSTAKALFGHHGERCEAVPFFSYMPQYDQMSRAQLAWYLYWRDCVRGGEYPSTDYSYIFLFIFEIINLPDEIPPMTALPLLCRIWRQYRKEYPLLDRYLSDWICDYCLLYQLPVPHELLRGFMSEIAQDCRLREFYVAPTPQAEDDDVAVFLNFCTNYDYKKSRAYASSAEHAAAFEQHIPAALAAVLRRLSPDNALFAQTKMQTSIIIRDTFVGALCARRIKYKIEVKYRSFSRSHELRFFITDVIKYSENKLRAALGYKSRLSVFALPEAARIVLNEYFAAAFGRPPARDGKQPARPDYEALYDLPATELSSDNASEIEQQSWQTTRRLVEAFSEQPSAQYADEPQASAPSRTVCPAQDEPVRVAASPVFPAPAASAGESAPFSREQLAFLRAALCADVSGQREVCRRLGTQPDIMADTINQLAAEHYEDILLEESDNGYVVIEDYRELARTALGDAAPLP